MLSAFVAGLAGPRLDPREAAVLAEVRPCGVIVFARNVESPEQMRRLTGEVQAAIGSDDILVLVDQEGGRVQRLRPPHWRPLPAAAALGAWYDRDPDGAVRAARQIARLAAEELRAVGINMNCAPVLDVPSPGSHEIIGDRAYGRTVALVVALGRAVAEGLMAGGVVPVIKHVPGHGRATQDSHHALPVVSAERDTLEACDFAPFRALADLPAAMTAHLVYTAVDAEHAASVSARVIAQIVRGAIGFDGLLMSDDLGMAALSGTLAERARAVIGAGCDIALLCSGSVADTQAVAAAVPPLQGRALDRFRRARGIVAQQRAFDVAEAEACLAQVLSTRA
jgi:beta-N-acetylhexosaminidase